MKSNHIKSALRRMARPRLFILCASLILALLAVMGTTFAWLVSSDAKTNEMGIMQYLFITKLAGGSPVASAIKGSTILNEAHVENTGDIPAFVRVMVFPTLVAADGVTLLEMQLGTQVVLGALGTGWVDGKDGYYYCLGRLGPGDATAPLFEEVVLDANIAGTQQNATLNIAVVAESIDGTNSYYREAWWGDVTPTAGPLKDVDKALQAILVK